MGFHVSFRECRSEVCSLGLELMAWCCWASALGSWGDSSLRRHCVETLESKTNQVELEAPESWVAVKELNSSYYIREPPLFTIYTHYGNLI